jgi:hypothetical protein
MSQSIITRSYPFADGELKQKADGLATTLTRDLPDLAARKITDGFIKHLRELTTNFDEHSTDQELLGLVQEATTKKNATRRQAEIAIRSIRNMADITWGSSGKYKNFGFEEMTELTDADFYRLAKRVVRMSTKYLPDLEPQGLTTDQIAALQTLAKGFDDDIDAIEDAIETRDTETQERINKGNTLWAEMSKLASVGKSVYEDTNEAKFNDYVLMPSPESGGKTDAPTS